MSEKSFTMSRRTALFSGAALASLSTVPGKAHAAGPLSGTIMTGSTRDPIPKHIYGGFQEHIGALTTGSMWAQVLDDRKFFSPIEAEKEEEEDSSPFARMMAGNLWTIMEDSSVQMVEKDAWVGDHSPVVTLAGGSPRGFRQKGLAIRNISHDGRIVAKASSGARITIALVSGGERKTVTIRPKKEWDTYSFSFPALPASDDGMIEISGTGSGTFSVGAVSLMPSDNVEGYRPDTLALMKEMNGHILRMPGGNYVSGYDWKDTIGDPDKRPPTRDVHWNTIQQNDFGVHEWLRLCELMGYEPSWCVSTGFDSPTDGAAQVEYINGSTDTYWGGKRAEHGRAEPYNVKEWNVGNEMYGHWQMGHMARDQYIKKHKLFVEKMREVDPSIVIVAPGGFLDEMTTGQGIFIEGQPEVILGSDRDWAYGMIRDAWGTFDGLATHAYPPNNKKFDLKTGELHDIEYELNEWAHQMPNRIQTMVDSWNRYKEEFPEKLGSGKVKVYFDEWAYGRGGTMREALAVAVAFHEFFRHTDLITMAAYTMATSWMSYNRTESMISTNGKMFQLYNRHFGTIPVDITGNSPVPKPRFPIGGDQPTENTGSPTWPLDLSAALSEDRSKLIVAMVNATEEEHSINLALDGVNTAAEGKTYKINAPLDAANRVGQEPEIEIAEGTFDATQETYTVPAGSVELYEFSLT